MMQRNISGRLLDGLRRTPVVYLNGARQTGKSTLAATLKEKVPRRYVTLDDAVLRTAALADPQGFLESIQGPVLLDEFQLVPELSRVLKFLVDRERTPGRFLLTGSAHAMVSPQLMDALVGRIESRTLWPLSAGEQRGIKQDFIARLFAPEDFPLHTYTQTRQQTLDYVACGGFPEVVLRDPRDRPAWFTAYISSILTRDVRELAAIENLGALPNLLALLATRAATLLNTAELSRTTGLPNSTLRRYLTLLESTFLIVMLPAWSANLGKRLVKAPKVLFTDTGLAAHLAGWRNEPGPVPSPSLGPRSEERRVGKECRSRWSPYH